MNNFDIRQRYPRIMDRRSSLWAAAVAVVLCLCSAMAAQVENVDLGSTTSLRTKKYLAATEDSSIGASVSKAGDVNGDSKVDFIVGGPMASMAGVVFVLFGTATNYGPSSVDFNLFESGPAGFKITPVGSQGNIGQSVSGGGDFNGDGFDDVLVASPSASAQGKTAVGMVFVIFGHSNNISFADVNLGSFMAGSNGFTISGADAFHALGCSVAFAGDFNGDGVDDIVLGTEQELVYVLFGSSISTSVDIDLASYSFGTTTGLRVTGAVNSNEYFGKSVAGAGDVNADGKADIIIGAPGTTCSGNENCGATYVLFGSAVLGVTVDKSNIGNGHDKGFQILGGLGGTQSGASVSGAGDVNGDNIDDMIVGEPFADIVGSTNNIVDAGMAYVIFGRNHTTGGLSYQDIPLSQFSLSGTSQGFGIMGGTANARSGFAVSGAANDSPIVSGYSRSGAGITYVVYGRRLASSQSSYTNVELSSLSTTASAKGFAILGAAADDCSGYSVSAAGDLNGDGSSDLLVGAPCASPIVNNVPRSSGGIAYVVYGAFPEPTYFPTVRPSGPSLAPTKLPSKPPTPKPTTAMPSTPFPSTPPPTSQPTSQPTSHPSRQPSTQPSRQPSSQPTRQPSTQPSRQPSGQPSSQPTRQPSGQPLSRPSAQPVGEPSKQPTGQPSGQPVSQPTKQPSAQPSAAPSDRPTNEPSKQPSSRPTGRPTSQPVGEPSRQPTAVPSAKPSGQPTSRPSLQATGYPTSRPTAQPTSRPSARPFAQPTSRPSAQPTGHPTSVPTARPTLKPTSEPSSVPEPSAVPSAQPTSAPTFEPTGQPTSAPTARRTSKPSAQPTSSPTSEPSGQPTSASNAQSTSMPTARPSAAPTLEVVTSGPSRQPSVGSTSAPTELPSVDPSRAPLVL